MVCPIIWIKVLKKFKEKEKAARDSRCPDRDSIRTIPT
jgi:hypothetical protein